MTSILCKRPAAFRVPRLIGDQISHWQLYTSEHEAYSAADTNGVEYEALYNRDGTATVAEWEPIETAPTDGAWILIWEIAGINTKYSPADVAHYHLGDWYNADKQRLHPSHWMPLPAPPSPDIGIRNLPDR